MRKGQKTRGLPGVETRRRSFGETRPDRDLRRDRIDPGREWENEALFPPSRRRLSFRQCSLVSFHVFCIKWS